MLERISGSDPEKACRIIDQSIENGYKGLFKLQESKKNNLSLVSHLRTVGSDLNEDRERLKRFGI